MLWIDGEATGRDCIIRPEVLVLLTREMGYSLHEFTTVLPRAMRDWQVINMSESCWMVVERPESALANIAVALGATRDLGALQLPTLLVEVKFLTDDSDLQAEFLRRFERGFQRGGG